MEPIDYIKWRDEYNSGIDIIDRQHKDIVKALNDIYLTIEKGRDVEKKLPELLEAIDRYAIIHHHTEEGYADKYNFPKAKELKESHEFFYSIYRQLRTLSKYKNTPGLPRIQYITHLHAVMSEWLMFHFTTIDKELFDYLREAMSKE